MMNLGDLMRTRISNDQPTNPMVLIRFEASGTQYNSVGYVALSVEDWEMFRENHHDDDFDYFLVETGTKIMIYEHNREYSVKMYPGMSENAGDSAEPFCNFLSYR